jgi:hypothetical protein
MYSLYTIHYLTCIFDSKQLAGTALLMLTIAHAYCANPDLTAAMFRYTTPSGGDTLPHTTSSRLSPWHESWLSFSH